MRTSKRFRVVAVVVLAVGLCIAVWAVMHPREPVYQGRTASYWLDEVATHTETNSLTAIEKLGPNVLTFAIRKIERDDSKWRAEYAKLWGKSPALLRRILPELDHRCLASAVNVFILVGHPCVPRAIQALNHRNVTVREEAVSSLIYFNLTSDEARQAIPVLTKALGDSDSFVRVQAVVALGKIGADASNAVPTLTATLTSIDWGWVPMSYTAVKPHFSAQHGLEVRKASIDALGKIGPPARSSVGALKNLLQDPDSFIRAEAAVAIWRIDGETDANLPVLLGALAQPSTAWRDPEWIATIGKMGPRAVSAVPLLIRLVQTQDQTAPVALQALRRIDPEAAERLAHPKDGAAEAFDTLPAWKEFERLTSP